MLWLVSRCPLQPHVFMEGLLVSDRSAGWDVCHHTQDWQRFKIETSHQKNLVGYWWRIIYRVCLLMYFSPMFMEEVALQLGERCLSKLGLILYRNWETQADTCVLKNSFHVLEKDHVGLYNWKRFAWKDSNIKGT